MTQIDSVEIDGLCGVREPIAFAPVSVFHGPNGSGKSTIVGAVAYALTGRFPGVVGVTVPALQVLSPDPDGFSVRLHAHSKAGEIHVERGIKKGKRFLSVRVDGRTVRAVDDASLLIRKHFGDVEWFADSFDPERSFWRMSQEKRSRWMFELCASASGWTKERVLMQLGDVTGPPPQSDWNPHLGRDAASNVEINMQQLEERLLSAQRVVRESTSIAAGIAAPTVAPTEEQLRAAEQELRSATEAAERARFSEKTHAADAAELDAHIAKLDGELLEAEILSGGAPSHCPTCLRALDAGMVAAAAKALEAKRAELAWFLADARATRNRLGDVALSLDDGDVVDVHRAVARYEAAMSALSSLRQQDGVARERVGQLAAAEGAEKRIVTLKALLEQARVVRRAMLNDSIEPLRKALAVLNDLAPSPWRWHVSTDGSFLMVVDGTPHTPSAAIAVEAMSAGEKYRATVALLVATSMIRREPWAGLFLDAFEQVSEDVRPGVIAALATIQKAGHVDNVFVAGAFTADGTHDDAVAFYARVRP